ncbi:gamma-aminobutyraldehyde dehydrogenase [Gordonia desulfuricans]|uniref:Gamma-aminobutyraldehyde dehydrogenase n=1 Tax=Gordonia desulfuricans TaxID=89051 RepID=A0A7K3LVG8_9ACTN|nr:gamma-aminobutyraldehyde dehydrogenase [Gordonia desulfuricans]NDK92280.1 gamma-aminobutyraldehyde dehydrogenase [Gordonia desulfuricans]
MWNHPGQYIDGRFVDATGPDEFTVIDPSTGQILVTGPEAGVADVDAAVDAATTAFGEWGRTTPGERSELIGRWAGELSAIADELAAVESRQAGKPIRLTTEFDVPGTIDNTAFFAGAARHLEGKASAEYSPDHTSTIRREPIGVIGSIAPWNYPLQMAAWKILPAVAAGNTIVLKPSELTPLTSLMFADAASRAGIPAGVINVVTGRGVTTGTALVGHRDVSMVSFTGSTPVGRAIAASVPGRRLHLELGGKAPFVVFDDADLEAAAQGAVAGSLINTGQDCTAATRAYVQRPLYAAFVERVAELMSSVVLGATDDPATDLGPLISRDQQQRVAAMVDRAAASGATVVTGGQIPGGAPAGSSYYLPTLITDATQDSEIVQDEVFGPVLVALPFDTDDEGIRLANDTVYGLAASAWTQGLNRAGRASREIRAGCVWINDHIPIISEMPHGGLKASGYGKDMSTYSLDEYTNIKHVMTDITGVARKGWHRTVFRGHSDQGPPDGLSRARHKETNDRTAEQI